MKTLTEESVPENSGNFLKFVLVALVFSLLGSSIDHFYMQQKLDTEKKRRALTSKLAADVANELRIKSEGQAMSEEEKLDLAEEVWIKIGEMVP